MESRLLLNVCRSASILNIDRLEHTVIGKGSAIFQLLSGEDESLLIRGDTLLVLDLALDVVDRIGRLDLEGDGLSRQGLDKDLHTTSESENQMEGGFLLDVCWSALARTESWQLYLL